MLRKGAEFWRWSGPWRDRFGLVAGLRVAVALRRVMWAGAPGSLVRVAVPTLPHPVFLRAGTSDGVAFIQVFGDRQAEFPLSVSPDTIVDAGANIGLTAAVFATRFPAAHVLALEIEAANVTLLRRNTAAYPNIEVVHQGLWSGRTSIRVANPEAESWGFQASETTLVDPRAVPGLGVADVLAEHSLNRIDLLKMDIEGSEVEVFSHGVDDWIDRVDAIAIEVHDSLRPGCTDVVRGALVSRGFHESRWSEYLIFRRERNPL